MKISFIVFGLIICFCHVSLGDIEGEATYYEANGLGACSFIQDKSSPMMVAALTSSSWDGAANCGRCVKVSNTNGTSIIVRIIDKCPHCNKNQLDLSKDAFGMLAKHRMGRIPITYKYVACPTEGNIKYRVKDGSSEWWRSVVVNNHKVGVTKFEIKSPDTDWVEVKRADYNEFELGGKLSLPLSFRVTGVNGEVITDENIVSKESIPGVYTSSKQFSGRGAEDNGSTFSRSKVLIALVLFVLLYI